MYTPRVRRSKTGVPILRKSDFDEIGEEFIRDFQPEILRDPAPVDIEKFVEFYLGMTMDYQFLSHNGIYLGMTVFNDTNRIPVYIPELNRAEYISAKAGTVIIDRSLLEEKKNWHRYRFTVGHEGSHGIFHEPFFSYDPNQLTLADCPPTPLIQCRIDNSKVSGRTPSTWTDRERMEYQANQLSSCLLMPVSAVRLLARRYETTNPQYHDSALVHAVYQTFDVSPEAATYRLRGLGLINREFTPCYTVPGLFDIFPSDEELACSL